MNTGQGQVVERADQRLAGQEPDRSGNTPKVADARHDVLALDRHAHPDVRWPG